MANAVLYGFLQLKDIFSERVTATNGETVYDAIEMSVAEHNRQIDALTGLFASPTDQYTARFLQGGNHRLQPLDENGRARPIKPSGHYDVAFPIRDAGIAWGANYKSRAKLTVGEANRITAEMLKADAAWMRDQIMAALFANATYIHADEAYGDLTIQPLAITSDSVTYPRTGSTATSTDQHLLATADAVADATDPVEDMVEELMEHPENAGEVILLIPSNLKADFRGLTLFHAESDPNIRRGANSDEVVGTLGAAVPGEVLGYHEAGAWIVEWKNLPDNYVIGTTSEGERALRMRQEPEPELQGFHLAGERNDHPYFEEQWVRFAGFGAYNRTGAIVQRFGNGTYAVPTGYAQPLR